jgi:ABC-type glycerol-3-phosphate transport system substrate-binding protein
MGHGYRQESATTRPFPRQTFTMLRLWAGGCGRQLLRCGPLVGLVALLQGCSAVRQTLHVVVVPTSRLEWLQRDDQDRIHWEPLLREFQRLHPDAQLQFSVVPEVDLEATLRRDRSRGLGPDLLVLRAPVANALLEQGLVDRFNDQPAWRRSRSLLEPSVVQRATTAPGVSGLPLYSVLTLACFDRQAVPQPPASLAELLALAASGRPVGVAVDPIGIWWSAGALGAQDAMVPILTGNPQDPPVAPSANRDSLLRWLTWMRQLSLQSRVDVGSGPRELIDGLASGRLSWIPCYSPALGYLERSMGKRLGVAPLPGGPAGPPTPYTTMMVMALGSDSSPRQRRLALELAELSLDPLVQRKLTLQSQMVLPANRYVPVPVASSGRLAALEQAQRQFNGRSRLLTTSFSADRERRKQPLVEELLWKVMLGVVTPQQGVEAMMRLGPPS